MVEREDVKSTEELMVREMTVNDRKTTVNGPNDRYSQTFSIFKGMPIGLP
jgi:hypothetical protein